MNDIRKSSIYMIRNKINGLMYIGSAINVDLRWKSHLILLRCGTHNSKLQKAWDEFGENAFEFVIIEKDIPLFEQFTAEQYWLDNTKVYEDGKGYNVCPRAGSYIPLTNETIYDRHKESLENIKDMLSEINRNIPYRTIAKNFKVSLGFIHSLKMKYLPDLIILDHNRKESDNKKRIERIHKKEEKYCQKQKILDLLALGKTYREISKELKVSIGTVCSSFKSSYIETKIKRKCSKMQSVMNIQNL